MHQHTRAAASPACKSMAGVAEGPVQLLSLALQHPQHHAVWRACLTSCGCNTGGALSAVQDACMRSSAHIADKCHCSRVSTQQCQ